ncbi:MAG: RagB/SusD family nutrient uptake outer membrane protein, partial [Gemmatimonadetes bacterium]|nr:RagB/SusD family nutrient uptake outer membrane protein [Gemmatimonadota bacterium]
EIAEEVAIVDEATAEAALMGAYSALQSDEYLGGDYVIWSDLLTDDAEHTGTFGSYGQADVLAVPADNFVVTNAWEEMYDGINRVNVLIEKVTELDNIDQDAADRILGQAYGLRALNYFHLVRAYGGVPLVLAPPASLDEASAVRRATAAEVYAQIEADLAQAASLLASGGVDNSARAFVTPGFVDALLAQAHLYQEEWAQAEAAARAVVNSGDYALAADYAAVFAEGGAPAEDIFRLSFTSTDANVFGHYYQFAGRFEVGATTEIYDLYGAADERFDATFGQTRPDGIEVVKYVNTSGTDDVHVIRYGEVLLILAEALAEQNELAEAVLWLNEIRSRANTGPFTYVPAVTTQQQVLDAIYRERRLELAFEGERWFDLVRTGQAAAALGTRFQPHEGLWPIPQTELDVAENIVQNPGYEQ